MSYAESISLKLINNTSTDQPIGLLGGTSSIYANSDNNVLVLWDLSTEDFTGTTVTLETTTPVTVDLKTQSVKGVADALNTTNKATFTFSGTFIYATSLLDNSVQSADIVVGDSVSTPVTLGIIADSVNINSFTPAQIKNLWINSTTRDALTRYISTSDSVEVGTQFYTDEELQNESFRTGYLVQGLSNTEPFNLLGFGDGVIQDIISSSDLPTNFSPSINQLTNFAKTTIFQGNNGLPYGAGNSALNRYQISTNGKYLFGISSFDNSIYRFTFTTAFDYTTLDFSSPQTLDVTSLIPLAGTQFNFTLDPSGNNFYVWDDGNNGFRQIFLSVSWDLTTATVFPFSPNITGFSPRMAWNENGNYLVSILNGINLTNFSTPYQISSYNSNQNEPSRTTYINTVDLTSPNFNQIIISSDGTKWYSVFSGQFGGIGAYQIVENNITNYGDITTITQSATITQNRTPFSVVGTGLWWSQDNTKLYVISSGSNGDTSIDEISVVEWNINGYSISQTDSSFSSPNIQDWFISNDGNWLFLADTSSNRLAKYQITTPFDMSTLSGTPTQSNFSILTPFTFADNGNYLYTQSGTTITRYPTTAPYDIVTLSSDQSASISTGTMEFSPDGLKVYFAGGTAISEYSLSTAFDITSFSLNGSTDVSTMGITLGFSEVLRNISFSPDGTKLMIFVSNTTTVPNFTAKVFQCTCSTPFDVSTATYDNVSVDTTANGTNRNYGGIFNPNGSKFITLYLNGSIGSSSINKFETYS